MTSRTSGCTTTASEGTADQPILAAPAPTPGASPLAARRAPVQTNALRAATTAQAWFAHARTPRAERLDHRIVVNSLPKSGTTLLLKALAGMPGTRPTRPGLFGRTFPPVETGGVALGVDSPVLVDPAAIRRRLTQVPGGTILPAHAGHSAELASIFRDCDVRVTVIVRDPRDVASSLGPYVAKQPQHFLHDRFAGLDEREQVRAALHGQPDAEPPLRDLATRYRHVMAWADEPNALLLRFEDLVGPKGGGDADAQLGAVRDLADHVGAALTDDSVRKIAEQLFGGTSTFRKGQIAGWRATWDEDLLAEADEVLGGVLDDLGYPRR